MPARKPKTVSRSTLYVSVGIAVALTAVIVATMVFAWKNAEDHDRFIFRGQLQDQERRAIQQQMDILRRGESSGEAEPAE